VGFVEDMLPALKRLVTFERNNVVKIGAQLDKFVVDLTAGDSQLPNDMKHFLAGGEKYFNAAKKVLASDKHRVPLSEVKLRAPVLNPDKIICVGLNYTDHAIESNMAIPKEPVLFAKFPNTIIGPEETIIKPKESNEVDYEVEMVVVIGKKGHHIKEAEARSYIAGYTVGHDVSARDWQLKKAGGQWTIGKTFDTFAPIGPAIVTSESGFDPHNAGIRCLVNGETVQNSNTNQLIFTVDQLVSYISQVITLTPGDLIFTGTPPGVGFARKPPLFLKHGDTVICEIDGIGSLKNPVYERQ